MILMSLLLIILVAISQYVFRHYNKRRKLKSIPGPKQLPFFGNMFELMCDPEQIFGKLRQYAATYGEMYRLSLPGFEIVTISDPEDVEMLFKSMKHIQKNVIYRLLSRWLGDGLLLTTGCKWQKRRRILTPSFHFNVLQKYMEVILKHADLIAKDLKNEEGQRIKNLQPWVSEHTLNTICETAMGVSFRNLKADANKYKEAVHDSGAILVYRSTKFWLLSETIFSWTSLGKKYAQTLKTLHNFSTNIINERKKFHEETNGEYLSELNDNDPKQKKTQSHSGKNKSLAMLDILINAYWKKEIDDQGIREEVDTFVFEGYDTTAAAMCYTILCLAEYTDIQARARDEIDKIWQESDGNIGMAEVQKFAYLERCIKETLRIYPSVPTIARQITEELQLKQLILPANIDVTVSIIDIHRNPALWPNPEVYDPDRFLPENSQGRHPFSYIPFSGGYRNCIGQKFAMLELKTVIGFLLHNFVFEAIEKTKDIRPTVDLVLRSKNQLRVRFIPINK